MHPRTLFVAAWAVPAAALVASAVAAFATGWIAAAVVGVAVLVLGAALVASLRPRSTDLGRRRVLAGLGIAGIGAVAGGSAVGRALSVLEPELAPGPVLRGMARRLGGPAMRSVLRGYHPERSGDLQMILQPFNTSNYPHESRSLVPDDPRSSHSLVWGYTDRVPIVVYAPNLVEPQDRTDEATLADLAPTTARLMGLDVSFPDGEPLPGIEAPARPPKVIVTCVIDGGGWNVLQKWPDAWPMLARLARDGALYRNGYMGSFPNVTASAHATIGTGAFPRAHGISGHHVRAGRGTQPALGELGAADPSRILVPTLADVWDEETGGRAWIGEIGYQVWHLGMIGRGGERPVAVYWDEAGNDWAVQNPELYRMPGEVPPRAALTDRMRRYFGPERGAARDREGGKAICCDPPIVEHQGDLLEATLRVEPIGETGVTDLLYVNYKAPDYAGHVSNMLDPHERVALEAVDRDLERLVAVLERRFRPGEWALILTADHGQCPLIEEAGGVRLDLVQLSEDLEGELDGGTVVGIRPSEVFLDADRAAVERLATSIAGYRYGENVGPYVPEEAVLEDRMDRRHFAAVLPGSFIRGLDEAEVAAFGPGRFAQADPGVPPRSLVEG
ncbi:MAG TPA: alkaline phosphatase family protein [Actinomycetota bacterium]